MMLTFAHNWTFLPRHKGPGSFCGATLWKEVLNFVKMGIYLTKMTQPVVSHAVEDYPQDLLELEARFSTEEACRAYLFPLRWPDGFECPRCQGRKAWPASDLLWECAGCHRPEFGDCWDGISGQPPAIDSVVPGGVVGDQPEERSKRDGPAAPAGLEKLQDSLDYAA